MLPKRDCESTGLNSFTVSATIPPAERGHAFLTGLLNGLERHGVSGQGMLLAVSGGADSMAMLHGLVDVGKQSLLGRIAVAHLNHGLRGKESDQDARFVEETCSVQGVECVVERLGPGTLDIDSRGSLEEVARKARYEFLARTAKTLNLPFILTAHHQQDQTETLVFNILRGTGLRGLCGIPEVRELASGLHVVRPMLNLSPIVIRDFMRRRGIAFREDSSNGTSQFTRNQIRQVLSSMPKEISGSLGASLQALSDQAGCTMRVIDELSARILRSAVREESEHQIQLDCRELLRWPEPVVRHALILQWARKRWPRQQMNAAQWERLAKAALTGAPRRWTFPGGITSVVRRKMLTLLSEPATSPE
jgi:tRNA(Ile)-lysidine synthase